MVIYNEGHLLWYFITLKEETGRVLILRGAERQGSEQERGRGFCQDGSHWQHHCPRSSAGLGTALGVNLSGETSKRVGKQSGARLMGRHQRSRLSSCQTKPCSASRSSSEVCDCSRDGGGREGKAKAKSSGQQGCVWGGCKVLVLPAPARRCLDGFGQGRETGLQTTALELEEAA